jgi:hypothetical protein
MCFYVNYKYFVEEDNIIDKSSNRESYYGNSMLKEKANNEDGNC